MQEEMLGKGKEVLDYLVTLDFTTGNLYFIIVLVIAGFCCFEGFRIYKLLLGIVGFGAGFYFASQLLTGDNFVTEYIKGMELTPEAILGIEVGAGLIGAFLAFKVVMIGVFLIAYQFAMTNLVGYLPDNAWRPVSSVLFSAFVGFLSTKSIRVFVVAVTAVAGGFAMANALQGLLLNFLPEIGLNVTFLENPMVWIVVKVFLAAAGFGIQGARKPGNE